ncbi:hypothetical protein [Thalassomonas actiniarum]|uniref:Uncharacterized protein n=1 Tax=Thalassomonas actiniarum TaxID=485447 RepID=A0AAF0C2G6_9GAMM|nr:hypothetical protein [Thalassomonas actiniarum]WDD97883.1 hypothetical protein SG35_021710 [Thalassomonas actiniarum]
MKLSLNKNKLKNLSKDNSALPVEMTPQVGGAGGVTRFSGGKGPDLATCYVVLPSERDCE